MIQEIKNNLLDYFRDKKVVIAFSGGVDRAIHSNQKCYVKTIKKNSSNIFL